jgi:hypothetical protein
MMRDRQLAHHRLSIQFSAMTCRQNINHSILSRVLFWGSHAALRNGTAIFTNDGNAARRLQNEVQAGTIGINVHLPVPMA